MATVIVVLAGCSPTTRLSSGRAPETKAADRPTPPATIAPGARPTAPPIFITVAGSAAASSVVIDINNHIERRHAPVLLPFTYTDLNLDDVDGAYPVTIVARNESALVGAQITCTIVEDGVRIARSTARGPHAVSACSDHQPGDPAQLGITAGTVR